MTGVLTAGQYATATLAIVGLLGVLYRFFVLLPLKNFIKEQTYPIQPNANGGRSLPDVVLGIEAIKYRIDRLEQRIDKLDTPNK
jgi:hypothetical protein